MNQSPITFCIGTNNNLPYLKLAVQSVREQSHYKNAPFIIYAENCNDGTYEWLAENKFKYNLTYLIENNSSESTRGIGGSMNICAGEVKTEYIMFLHSDFYVSKDWDIACENVFKKYPNIPLWVSSYRIQPNIFNENSRPGTLIVPNDEFGVNYSDFNAIYFLEYASEFAKLNNIEIRKGEGVSGLIRKSDWDYIGGCDEIFNPASFDDMDLFLRMQLVDYKFVLTSKSIVWHFGARGSHRLEDNNGKTSERQKLSESRNYYKWIKKWGFAPTHDSSGFISFPFMLDKNNYKHLIQNKTRKT